MLPDVWGPIIWKFFHTVAENIREENDGKLASEFFIHIRSICGNLPCPECTQHATSHIAKITPAMFKTKTDLRLLQV